MATRRPARTSKAERQYGRQLRKLARHIGDIVNGFPAGDPAAEPSIRRALVGYADLITAWATTVAQDMLDTVAKENENEWRERTEQMGRLLREQIRRAPVGATMRALLAEQVTLIKSLPIDAAQRVHDLTLRGIETATRPREIAAEIMRTEEVSASKARLIARTEAHRTAEKLTEARARHVGSEGYIWRTAQDGNVRDSHKEMNGKFVRWDSPPTLSDGTTTHAGQIYNCRCFADPVIPE
jgi:SPP1 gp7 family putative phage head morphogenesis protein